MAHLTLVTGGCRSGKSSFALAEAGKAGGPHIFLATSPPFGSEMEERIALHIKERKDRGWQTREEQINVAAAIAGCEDGATILLDCLTLWISNLLFQAEDWQSFSEDVLAEQVTDLLSACAMHQGRVIMVTNEVGCGIVPENELARKYRDLAGRCNQLVAAAADECFLVSCGIPLRLK